MMLHPLYRRDFETSNCDILWDNCWQHLAILTERRSIDLWHLFITNSLDVVELNWCDSGCWEWLLTLSAWWFYQDIISKPLQLLTDFNRSQRRFLFFLDILQYCNILWETCWQTQCETAINQLWGDPPRHFFTSLRANTENVKRSKGRESRKNSTHSRGERSLTRVPTLVEVTCKVEEYCVTFSSGYNLMKVFYAFFLPVSNIF